MQVTLYYSPCSNYRLPSNGGGPNHLTLEAVAQFPKRNPTKRRRVRRVRRSRARWFYEGRANSAPGEHWEEYPPAEAEAFEAARAAVGRGLQLQSLWMIHSAAVS